MSLLKFKLLKTERSTISKIGLYAIVQRTMPESVRSFFRLTMRARLAMLWLRSKIPFITRSLPQEQTARIEEGKNQLQHGRIEEASHIFQNLLKTAPLNEVALLWSTRINLIQGNYLEAQKILFRALAWHRHSFELHQQHASLLLATGAFWDAETEYRKLIAKFPKSNQALLALASLSLENLKYEEAINYYKAVLENDQTNIAAILGIAECIKLDQVTATFTNDLKSEYAGNEWFNLALDCNSTDEAERKAQPENQRNAVLIIDHFLPTVDRSAGNLRLFEIVRLIHNDGYHVTVIARNGEYQERSKRRLESLGVEVHATDPERFPTWSYKPQSNLIDFADIFEKHNYVLAIISRYQLAEIYLPLLRKSKPDLPIAIDTVDVHFVREEKKEKLYSTDRSSAESIRSEELSIYDQADILISVSDIDLETLRNYFPKKRHFVIPLIYRNRPEKCSFKDRKDLLFVGNFVHPPNSDAFVYYCARILPVIQKRIPDIKTFVVGANSSPLLDCFANRDVIITGFVPRLEPFLRRCRVNVAPLRYGAGMNGKILESLAAGLPVVTSAVGGEGVADNRGFMIAEDPEEFAVGVERLYNDESLWNSMSNSGLDLIEDKFTPEVVNKELEKLLNAVQTNPV